MEKFITHWKPFCGDDNTVLENQLNHFFQQALYFDDTIVMLLI